MRRLIFLLLCVLLAGCFTSGKRGGDSAMAIFDFGPPSVNSPVAPRPGLVALEVRAPLWLDTLGIGYRLAYLDTARLREYTRARWAGPPAQMLQQQLARELGLLIAGQGQARCLMHLDITEFSQVFETPVVSHGVLQGRLALFDRSRRPLAELSLNIEEAAPTPDARGGVFALTAAVNRLPGVVGPWLEAQKGGAAAGCFD